MPQGQAQGWSAGVLIWKLPVAGGIVCPTASCLHMLKPEPPAPLNVTVFGGRASKDIHKVG